MPRLARAACPCGCAPLPAVKHAAVTAGQGLESGADLAGYTFTSTPAAGGRARGRRGRTARALQRPPLRHRRVVAQGLGAGQEGSGAGKGGRAAHVGRGARTTSRSRPAPAQASSERGADASFASRSARPACAHLCPRPAAGALLDSTPALGFRVDVSHWLGTAFGSPADLPTRDIGVGLRALRDRQRKHDALNYLELDGRFLLPPDTQAATRA
jgi:hypothetical protein